MSSRSGASVRPKRAGEAFARSHDQEHSPTKKLRFDARNPSQLAAEADDDGEDAILELDEIGKAAGTKRSAVNLDGYDSDSDNDNFNARAADRAREQKRAEKIAEDDGDEDMFADLEDLEDKDGADEDAATQKKSKKNVKFIDTDEIAGQNFSSKARSNIFNVKDASGQVQDDNEESDDSDSGGEEGRDHIGSDDDEQEVGAGGKKKHAPRLDAFNMRDEGEEGRFDESGNFVRRADPNAIHDSWLDGVSKKEMKKARDAEERRDEERRQKEVERDAVLGSDLLSTLISHLQPSETVLEALARLNRTRPKAKPKSFKQKSRMDVDSQGSSVDPTEQRLKAQVEAMTEAADTLLSRGQDDIYETDRELLMRQFKRESGEDWAAAGADGQVRNGASQHRQWHYRWADARDGGDEHGPYDAATLEAWIEAGYFGQGVEYKEVGHNGWTTEATFA